MSFPRRLSLLHPPIVFTVSADFFNSTSVSGKSSSSWRGATHYAVGRHTPRCEAAYTTLRGGIHRGVWPCVPWCLALRTMVQGVPSHGAGRPEPRCRASRGTVQEDPLRPLQLPPKPAVAQRLFTMAPPAASSCVLRGIFPAYFHQP